MHIRSAVVKWPTFSRLKGETSFFSSSDQIKTPVCSLVPLYVNSNTEIYQRLSVGRWSMSIEFLNISIILSLQTLIPNKTTTYLCKDFELPKYNQKMHIVKVSYFIFNQNKIRISHFKRSRSFFKKYETIFEMFYHFCYL